MGKFDEAIKVAEKIMDVAEQAELYSVVREEGEYIANLYKQAKDDHKFIVIREDFENLEEDFDNLIKKGKFGEAHDLVQTFTQYYEKKIDLESFENVKELLSRDSAIWNKFSAKEQNIIKQLEPLEIQFTSYINTNNLSLAGEVLEKAKILLKQLTNIEIIKGWETSEAMFIELRKKVILDENIENNLKEVSRLTENYEFDKAKKILNSNIEYLDNEELTEYNQVLKAKEKYIQDAERKYLKLEDDLIALEYLIKENIGKNEFKQAISNINQIIKISRFIGKTKNIERFSEYVNLIEHKIQLGAINEKIVNQAKELNDKAKFAFDQEEFENSLLIFKEIIELIKTEKPE